MMFGGIEHEQVDVLDAQPDDYVLYNSEHGRKIGRVARAETTRGRITIVTRAVAATSTRLAKRARRVDHEKVVSVWRRMRHRKSG